MGGLPRALAVLTFKRDKIKGSKLFEMNFMHGDTSANRLTSESCVYVSARCAGRDGCGKTNVTGSQDNEKPQDNVEFLVKYKGRSYNISDFLRLHPGGKNALKLFKNKNLDRALTENPHSDAAFHIFEDFAVNEQRVCREIENLVDWNKPLLWQVGSLAERYWEWVNLPVNRPIRLFSSDILEFLSVTPWYLIPLVWGPMALYFIYLGCSTYVPSNYYVDSTVETLIAFGFGVLLWTAMEYLLHRKLFHLKPPHDSRILITLHFLMHGLHHKAPFDGQRLLFPPTLGVVVAVIFLHIYKAIFPLRIVYFIGAGTTVGYMCYDLMHYYLHYGSPKDGTYLYIMKRNHNHHHFTHHNRGFGISSKLWDYVFGTEIKLRQLKQPIVW